MPRGDEFSRDIEKLRNRIHLHLKEEIDRNGYLKGELSSSALATVLSLTAFRLSENHEVFKQSILNGEEWIRKHVNDDGGFGDTPDSPSHLSTTLLVWAYFSFFMPNEDLVSMSQHWLSNTLREISPDRIVSGIKEIYGEDQTFAMPILLTLGLLGKLGARPDCWKHVPELPFELVLIPRSIFKFVNLPVVSYALPALIALGVCRHKLMPNKNIGISLLRNAAKPKSLRVLREIQPESGGYLEAIPLTAFVIIGLLESGEECHEVVAEGLRFLTTSQRDDGGFPIDSNLSVWLTSSALPSILRSGDSCDFSQTLCWLKELQYRQVHTYTMAKPGAWAWTELSGGVPDADDTSAALIALSSGMPFFEVSNEVFDNGVRWLFDLQNRDGGVPTFCSGNSKLPFDKSSPDITAHAIMAVDFCMPYVSDKTRIRAGTFITNCLEYLKVQQNEKGYWEPLWFGSPSDPDVYNKVYGTSKVISGLRVYQTDHRELEACVARGSEWLSSEQNEDGGWGGIKGQISTIEETALALGALGREYREVKYKGFVWLCRQWEANSVIDPHPMGLYFSSLWYSEKLYPYIFSLIAIDNLDE